MTGETFPQPETPYGSRPDLAGREGMPHTYGPHTEAELAEKIASRQGSTTPDKSILGLIEDAVQGEDLGRREIGGPDAA